jgi:hypothetical protein
LRKWSKNGNNDKRRLKQIRFRFDNLVQNGQNPEMEQELSSWIENGRAKGACIIGFVIRKKAALPSTISLLFVKLSFICKAFKLLERKQVGLETNNNFGAKSALKLN